MDKIVFNVDDMLPVLQQVCSVVSQKNTMPILSDVIIKSYVNKANGDMRAMLSTSDGEQWLSMTCGLVEGKEGIAMAINATDLMKALKNLSGHIVTVEVDNSSTVIKWTYENGFFSLPADNPNEFPHPVSNQEMRIEKIMDSGALLNAIAYVESSVSVNEVLRPVFTCVHFDFFSDRIVSVAMNKMRMAKRTDFSVQNDVDNTVGFNLPSATAKVMLRLLSKTQGNVKLSVSDNNIMLSRSDFRLVARLIEGKYPPYDQIIIETPMSAVVAREDFIKGLKRVMPMGSNDSEGVALAFESGLMTVSAEDINFSKSASESIKCDYDGDAFVICVNGSKTIEALSSITDDNVICRMTDKTKPMQLLPESQEENTEYIQLIMPMLLNI